MKILSVSIENFLSIEKADVTFDDAGLLLIEGWNHDVDRANGAGKTAILNAISFGLYDKLPRRITASEIVRRGAKKGHVHVRVLVDSNVYNVRRSRPKGVSFYTEQDGAPTEITMTQQEFESKLKLTYNQFIVSMYCSQATSATAPRFILLNDAEKKQFLLQLLNLDEFAACKKIADERIQKLALESADLVSKIRLLESKEDLYGESLVDEGAIQASIAEKEKTRETFLRALASYQEVVKPDLQKYQKLEEDISTKRAEFVRLRAQREMLQNQWNKLMSKSVASKPSTRACETCGTILDNSKAQALHNDQTHKLLEDRKTLKIQLDEIDAALLGESKVTELYQKLKEKKRKESAEYEQASLGRVEIKAKLESIAADIDRLNTTLAQNASLLEKLKRVVAQRQEAEHKLVSLKADTELQKTVAAIYSPTGAQAYVLDSAVALFNEHISKYVSALWPNLTYELQSYKETVKGDVTAKFSESIIMDGKPISLGSLSGGELRALSICADMALLGILEQQFGIHMSPIIFDEAFDGLDASGKEFALDLIKELSQDRQVVVIDHASEMRASFDKILRVEKRNGISSVTQIT